MRASATAGTASARSSAALSSHFETGELLFREVVEVLDGEHGLEGRDRDRELREVGLAGRQPLELDARPHEDLRPALVAVLAEPLDQLEREPGDERQREDPRRVEDVPLRRADRDEHEE